MYDCTFVRVVYHILNNFPKKRKVKKFQLHQIDEKPSKFRIGQLNNCKNICGTIQELNRDVFLPPRARLRDSRIEQWPVSAEGMTKSV